MVDNAIVLVAAFIQAFSTGIPMFMVIPLSLGILAIPGKARLIAK
jgi:hypothetical protein